jgi:NAD(P)H-hydrate epimerase
MIPVLNSEQIRKADQYTIENEPISSVELMERASKAFVLRFIKLYPAIKQVVVITGVGNNGGDGLVIARLLMDRGIEVRIFSVGKLEKASPDFKVNYQRIENKVNWINEATDFPLIHDQEILIEGLFGSGLSRPVEGFYARVITWINQLSAVKVSIDIASGLFADRPVDHMDAIITPDHTISFQVPKLAFFLPENRSYTGSWFVEDIGLDREFIRTQDTDYYLLEPEDVTPWLPRRHKFFHKGEAGRLMLIGGKRGQMGAMQMAGIAALRTGAGLVTLQVPRCGVDIIQAAAMELMVWENAGKYALEDIHFPGPEFVFGAGPGMGLAEPTQKALVRWLQELENIPVVLDADALNVLARYPDALKELPGGSILTPHPGEFQRLVGSWSDDYEKLDQLKTFARTHQLNVVLKGAYSALSNTDGKIFFNNTGNPGMASGGSGDVLFGMICGLLAQKLKPFQALALGVYLHGKAGDLAMAEKGIHGMIARDLIEQIPQAIIKSEKYNLI